MGEPRGRLDGVPVTVKELIATRGVPVPRGSAATALIPAVEDAPPVARLREDGAIIFAKTTCPDYGMLTSSLSSFHPLSRNPWDVRLNPGGSSAGASAAAAAGYGPLHVGTDIGGLDPPPGRADRHGRFQAQQRSSADRPLLARPLRRPDDPDGGGRGPADGDLVAPRPA